MRAGGEPRRPPLLRAESGRPTNVAARDPRFVRSHSLAPGAGSRTVRRARDRRRHHRRRRGARRRQPRPAHRARRARRLRLAARRRRARSSCTAGCATSSNGEVRLVYEALRRAPAASAKRPAPRARAPVPHPAVLQGRAHQPEAVAGAGQRDVDVRPHRRGAHRQAPQAHQAATRRSPTCRRCRTSAWPAPTSTTTPQADDARLTLTIAAHRGARPRRGGRQPRDGRGAATRTRDGAGVRRRSSTADGAAHRGARPVGRERGRRVGRRRARPRRGRAPRLDPAGQGHPHHGAVGQGPQRHRRRSCRCRRTSASIFVVPWGDRRSPTSARPTPTTTGRSTTRSARPRTSPTCSTRSTSSVQRAAHRGRRRRHVGRAAPARQGRHQRAHRRPVAPARGHAIGRPGVVTVTGGKLTTYREMAADTVDAVVRHLDGAPRRARRSRDRRASRLRGADGPDAPGIAGTSPDRYGSEAACRPGARSTKTRSLAEPLVAGLPYLRGRGRVRGAPRDGPTARRRAGPPHPRAAARRGTRRPPPRPTVAELIAAGARVVGRRGRRPGRRLRGVGRRRASGAGAAAHRRRAGRPAVTAPHDLPAPGPGRADAADRARATAAPARPPAWTPAPSPCPTTLLGAAPGDVPGHGRRRHRGRGEPRLVAAGDDLGARRPGRRASRGGRRPPPAPNRSPTCWRRATRRASPSPRPPVAAACAARRCRCTAASSSTSCGSPASSTSTTRRSSLDVRAGTFGDVPRARAAHHPRRHARPLAAVDRAVDGRRVAGVPVRRPALDPLREDRGHGRSASTSCWPTAAASRTGGRPACRRGPRPHPALRRFRGHARRSSRARACACTPHPPHERRAAYEFVLVRRRARRDAAHPPARRARPRCCGSTTPVEADRTYETGDRALLLVLDEGDRARR